MPNHGGCYQAKRFNGIGLIQAPATQMPQHAQRQTGLVEIVTQNNFFTRSDRVTEDFLPRSYYRIRMG